MRLWLATGCLPKAGGLDEQGAARLARMLWAGRVRALMVKKALSADWAADMTGEDLALLRVLYDEGGEDG